MKVTSRWFSLLLAATLVACSPSSENSENADSNSTAPKTSGIAGVLRRGNGQEPQTLDPHKAEGVPSAHILRDIFEGLTSEAPAGGVVPGVAESWEISDNGERYVFKLRQNARWSNGDPVVAEDFVFGLRRSVDPATLSNYSQILAPILHAEAIIAGEKSPETLGVKAIDERTLEIILRANTPYFLGLLNHSSSYPLHRASVETHGSQFVRPGNLVSNGAYKLSEWVVQSQITVVRNEMYWNNENTSIDKVVFYPLDNQSTELARYRAGELDMTYEVPNKSIGLIRERLADQLVISPYLGCYYYGFNVTKPPFKDNLPLRKALALAIDRDIVTERVMGTGEIPAYNWVPPVDNYTGQKPDWAAWTQAERNEEAKRLYAEAGYGPDTPLQTNILYNTSENHKAIAVAIAQMWKKTLGVETELLNQEWKVFLDTRKGKVETEVFRAGWIGDYDDPFTFSELLHSEHGINDSGYNNADYDALLEKASFSTDAEERRALLEQAERLVSSELPIVPIYHYVTKRLVSPRITNYQGNILDHVYSKNLNLIELQ